ncbi:MAG: aminotransferase class III-fold pyridoxal phosphate-dependent enzyme, partial [Candidatus Calescibacterium sp.]|nr:aminotransferase class III-fold pyridoxal phosphate-dependent enzyme [Candidatus Calescibacterium sp.]
MDKQKFYEIATKRLIPHFALWKEIEKYGPRIISRAKGVYLWDIDGNKYVDAMSILWVVNVGHGRREIIDAMREQMEKINYVSLFGGYHHEKALELADLICSILPVESVFFSNSGSEAI